MKKPKQGNGLFNDAINFGKKLVYGRNDYSPSSKRTLQQYGNEIVLKITIYRHPLPSFLTMIANRLTDGQPFDKLFHLYMIVETTSNHKILIEKNEVINISTKIPNNKEDDWETITNPPNITINQLLEKTQQKMGNSYFSYIATSNNCQWYILNILQANGISQAKQFILQDVGQISEEHPELRKVANTITDVASRIDVLKQGGKIRR